MKRLVAGLLLLIVLAPSIARVIYIGYWNINQEVIEKTFCENMDKPEMECHGQCHLEKTLKKIDDSKEENEEKNLINWNKLAEIFISTDVFLSKNTISNYLTKTSLESSDNFYFSNTYHFDRLESIFHPPC